MHRFALRSPTSLSTPVLALALVCACTAPSPSDESGTATTGETETTGEAASCELPNDDSPGISRPLTLTNVSDETIYILPEDNCIATYFHGLSVDGEVARDQVLDTCLDLAQDSCDSCDDPESVLPALRLEPGGSWPLHFDGYVYRNHTVDPALACNFACWQGEACPVGGPIAEGASVGLTLMVADTCLVEIDPADCECGPEDACELFSPLEFPNPVLFEAELVHSADGATIEIDHSG